MFTSPSKSFLLFGRYVRSCQRQTTALRRCGESTRRQQPRLPSLTTSRTLSNTTTTNTRTSTSSSPSSSSHQNQNNNPKRSRYSSILEGARFWYAGKSRILDQVNTPTTKTNVKDPEKDETTSPHFLNVDRKPKPVYLVIGMDTTRLELEFFFHVAHALPVSQLRARAPQIFDYEELEQLFQTSTKATARAASMYQQQQPKTTTTTNTNTEKNSPRRSKRFGFSGNVRLASNGFELVHARPPPTAKKDSMTENDVPSSYLLSHEDICTHLVPHQKEMEQVSRQYYNYLRGLAFARLEELHSESHALRENYAGVGWGQDAWNESVGPEYDFQWLRERFRITRRQFRLYYESAYTFSEEHEFYQEMRKQNEWHYFVKYSEFKDGRKRGSSNNKEKQKKKKKTAKDKAQK